MGIEEERRKMRRKKEENDEQLARKRSEYERERENAKDELRKAKLALEEAIQKLKNEQAKRVDEEKKRHRQFCQGLAQSNKKDVERLEKEHEKIMKEKQRELDDECKRNMLIVMEEHERVMQLQNERREANKAMFEKEISALEEKFQLEARLHDEEIHTIRASHDTLELAKQAEHEKKLEMLNSVRQLLIANHADKNVQSLRKCLEYVSKSSEEVNKAYLKLQNKCILMQEQVESSIAVEKEEIESAARCSEQLLGKLRRLGRDADAAFGEVCRSNVLGETKDDMKKSLQDIKKMDFEMSVHRVSAQLKNERPPSLEALKAAREHYTLFLDHTDRLPSCSSRDEVLHLLGNQDDN